MKASTSLISILPTLLSLIKPSSCAPTKPTAATNTTTSNTTALQFITIEEHYDSPSMRAYGAANPVYALLADVPQYASLGALIDSVNETRIESMNNNSIRIQVISNDPTPSALSLPSLVRSANNELFSAISPYPSRFRGFCFLPMAFPTVAVAELEHCIQELGFVGVLVDSHLANNTFYDGAEYDVLWSKLVELDVPIYLHPTYPPISQINGTDGLYTPNHDDYSEPIAAMFGTAAWGWHSDCGMQFLRLWATGTFDRYPDLKLVLGHMGEMLPYMLARSESVVGLAKTTGASLTDTYAKNVWVTTSGFFSMGPFATLWATTASDRIIYSVDYPWATNEAGTEFMTELKSSGLVSEEEWSSIAYGNAEELLGLN